MRTQRVQDCVPGKRRFTAKSGAYGHESENVVKRLSLSFKGAAAIGRQCREIEVETAGSKYYKEKSMLNQSANTKQS
jgi:hypothetical protein